MNVNKTKNSTNKKFGKIAALIFASLVLTACPNTVITPPPSIEIPPVENPNATVDELIGALTADVNALYDNGGNLIHTELTMDKIASWEKLFKRINNMGGGDRIIAENEKINELKNMFETAVNELTTEMNKYLNKPGDEYTKESWDKLTSCLAMPSTTFAEINEKVEKIKTAVKNLVEAGNGNTETPDVVGIPTVTKDILFNGTDLIVDDLQIGTSTKTITLTINKDPATTTDKISLKLISDLQRELEGTGETKRTVNLILGAGMNGYTLNGPDALNLHVGDYDGVTVSEIKPEDLLHDSIWSRGFPIKEDGFDVPHPRIIINATDIEKGLVLSGNFDAFYTEIKGVGVHGNNWNNVTLRTQSHPSGKVFGVIEVTPTELANYLTNLGPNATPILDITMNNGFNRGSKVPENLYTTLYPIAERYVKNGMVNNFNIKQGDKTDGNFETNGLLPSTTDSMFNGPNLNTNWAKIDAEFLMKFKQFGSVQNLIVEGTVPAGELLNGKNLAFTGDASKLTKVSIGGIIIYENLPAKKGGYDNVQFKKIGNDDVSFIFMDTLNVLNIEKVGSGILIDTHDKMNTGTIHKNSDIYIQGPSSQFSSTEPPDYEQIWRDSNLPAASKSSRVISAQQQKTR